MSIIIISSDAYSTGREIATKTAEALGYEFQGREILKKVVDTHQIEASKPIPRLY